ncbi:DUF3813 family protein [Paraliobacillus sp. JSM ZJ581]|uniref:DUF3813 family protein n=1 Tax=Paraliobacillus sp. JSM ZJ581 TaxID=3342118 RepID=UPI0035A906A5
MENRLMQQAKQTIQRLTNGHSMSDQDKQAATTAIQSAYSKATPEEQQELQKLEQQLRDH